MDYTHYVVNEFKESKTPLNAGPIAKMEGLDKKEGDKSMEKLKKKRRCYHFARTVLLGLSTLF